MMTLGDQHYFCGRVPNPQTAQCIMGIWCTYYSLLYCIVFNVIWDTAAMITAENLYMMICLQRLDEGIVERVT